MMNVSVPTTVLHAYAVEDLQGITWARMFRLACWANAGVFSGRKPEEWPGAALVAPQSAQQVDLFRLSGGLQLPRHGSAICNHKNYTD